LVDVEVQGEGLARWMRILENLKCLAQFVLKISCILLKRADHFDLDLTLNFIDFIKKLIF
jgi:hypothetical protein